MKMKHHGLRVVVAGALTYLVFFAATSTSAQSDAVDSVWDRWSVHDPAQPAEVDHSPMTSILDVINVSDRRRHLGINYSVLRGRALDYVQAYIDFLESVPVSKLNRDEQLAYWLNLHNAQVIEFIARDGTSRIEKRRGRPGEPGDWWSEKRLTVEGQTLSLEDIEQNILIRQWQDPILLYGLCYGVDGSPVIGEVAFSGATVHKQLQDAARGFINDSSNVRVRGRKNQLEVSSLYVWHKSQLFDNDDSQVIAHLQSFSDKRLTEDLRAVDSISKHRFDWSSNSYTPRGFNQQAVSPTTSPGIGAGS